MTLLVVSAASMFRDGLSLLLQARLPGVRLCFAEDCDQALALDGALLPPRLVLLDLALSADGCADEISRLRRAYPATPLMGLAEDQGDRSVRNCLEAGGRLCVLKSASGDLLVSAVLVATSGAVCLPKLLPASADPIVLPPERSREARCITPADLGLTPKQARVMSLLLEGKSAKHIARELGLCTGTVKTHTTAVLRALNVSTRVQAVLAARRLGVQMESCH